jgi:hypothetical protein
MRPFLISDRAAHSDGTHKDLESMLHGATRGCFASAIFLCCLLACKMQNEPKDVLPRNQSLPLFNPHVREEASCSGELNTASSFGSMRFFSS